MGYNQATGVEDKVWVNNQTTIIESESVKVKANTLTLTGATIANIKSDGSDGGNLATDANKIIQINLKSVKSVNPEL